MKHMLDEELTGHLMVLPLSRRCMSCVPKVFHAESSTVCHFKCSNACRHLISSLLSLLLDRCWLQWNGCMSPHCFFVRLTSDFVVNLQPWLSVLFAVFSRLFHPNDNTVLSAINAATVHHYRKSRSHLQVRQHCHLLIMVLGTLYQMVWQSYHKTRSFL